MSRLVIVLVGFLFIGSQASAVDCPVLSNKLLGSYCAGKKFFGLNKMPEGLYDDNGVSATIFLDKCPFFLFNIGKKKMFTSTRTADVIGQTSVPWNQNSMRFLKDMKINPAQKDQYEVKQCKYELRHETGSKQVKQAHIFVVGKKTSPQDIQENVGMAPPTRPQEERGRAPSRTQQPMFEQNPIQEQANHGWMNDEENPYHEPNNTEFGTEDHNTFSNTTHEPIFGDESKNNEDPFSPPPPPPMSGFDQQNYNGNDNDSFSPPPPPPFVGTKTDGNKRGFLGDINESTGKNLKPVDRSTQSTNISGKQEDLGNVIGNALGKRRAGMHEDEDLGDDDTDFNSDFGSSNYDSSHRVQRQQEPPVVQQKQQPLSKPIVGTGKKWTPPSPSSYEPSSGKGGLLDQIQKGAALKKVERPTEKTTTKEHTSGFNTDLLNKVKQHQNPNESDTDNDIDEGWD